MTGPLFSVVLAGCICVAMLGSSSARAAGGSIAFSGAIVEPTCAVSNDHVAALAEPVSGRRFTCGTSQQASQSYSLHVIPLASVGLAEDRLLAYFAGYLQPSARAEAKVVTRTYQ